jgi:hypothetical protein
MKDNYKPNSSNSNDASLASHSCTVGNSIEQMLEELKSKYWDKRRVLIK